MKKLFIKIFLLAGILLFVVIACLLLPPAGITRNSLLFAQIDKNNLLENTPGPRIIFVGGSNLSFGLNSQVIKDSLQLNPVNTAIHAGIGLKYMLLNTIRYVRENDIIVVSPEYEQFYGDLSNGQDELLSILVDVCPRNREMDFDQFLNMVHYFPKYSSSKLRFWNYFKKTETFPVGIYDRKSFNAYGDACVHWGLPGEQVAPMEGLKGTLNEDVITLLTRFGEMVSRKKAKLYITFPGYQDASFDKSIVQIKTIEKRLKEKEFHLLGTPERYRMADSLLFNTPYHLIKKGVDYRTVLLAEDLKRAITPAK